MAVGFKVKASPAQLHLNTFPVIPNAGMGNFHPLIKGLFSKEMLTKAVDIPPARKKSHFLRELAKVDFKPGYSVSGKGFYHSSRYLFNKKF